MYGQSPYAALPYGADHAAAGGETIIHALAPPVVANSFQLFAPSVHVAIPGTLEVPLIAISFQVFPPEAVGTRGRPLAEDIRIMSVQSKDAASGFHASLGSSLYSSAIERERRVLFGEASTCTLYSVTPGAGETVLVTLGNKWTARRIPTIESGAIEQWRLEIASSLVNWEMLRNVSTVLITPDTGEVQRYRVMQTENAMKPGKIYHLRIEAMGQI